MPREVAEASDPGRKEQVFDLEYTPTASNARARLARFARPVTDLERLQKTATTEPAHRET